jgi:phospholipase C
MKIQMLEERVQELENKTWQGNQAQWSLGKKDRWVDEEWAGGEGGAGREGGGLKE